MATSTYLNRPYFSYNHEATISFHKYLKDYAKARPPHMHYEVRQEAAECYVRHPMTSFDLIPCSVIPALLFDENYEVREDCPFDTDDVERLMYVERVDLDDIAEMWPSDIIAKTADLLDSTDLGGNIAGFTEVTGPYLRAKWAEGDDDAAEELADWLVREFFPVFSDALEEHYDDAEPPIESVYEWWQVDEFTFRALAAAGEITLEACGLRVWGRCCTGQSFFLDDVIQEIAMDLFFNDK